MPFDVRIVDPLADAGWDDALQPFPNAGIFHTRAWARVMRDCYGFHPRYITVFDGKRPAGHLPLMEVASWLTGRRGVSLPFTDYCEPLFDGDDALRALKDAALGFGRQSRWKYVEFRSNLGFGQDELPSLTYWHHDVPLVADEAAQFAALKPTVRTATRKAIAAGVRVEASHALDAVENFYALNTITRRAHGLPPQPRSFFVLLHREIISRGDGVVVQAFVESQPAAACVYLYRGKHALYKYGASNPEFQNLRVNDLVMWTAIRWLAERGCATMSMGKTAKEHEGLRRFKLGWGARETELRYYKYGFKAEALVKDRDAVAGWHNGLFRRMPLVLSRLAGALLYRHMA